MALAVPAIHEIHHVAHLISQQEPGRQVVLTHPQHVLSLHRCRGQYGLGGEWCTLVGPALILLPAGEVDDNRLVGRDVAWWCQFSGAAVRGLGRQAGLDLGGGLARGSRLRPLSASEDRTAGAWFRELRSAWNLATPAANLHCLARLYDLLALWVGPTVPALDPVERYRRLIEQRACDTVGVADLAACVGGDGDTLTAAFRRQIGCTPVQYRTRLRIQRARELLVHDRRSLAEIAALCGFQDAGYLCRVFRQHLGVSPKAYARRCGTASTGRSG